MAIMIRKHLEAEIKRRGLDERPIYKTLSDGSVVRNQGVYSHESEIEKITAKQYRAWPFCKKMEGL